MVGNTTVAEFDSLQFVVFLSGQPTEDAKGLWEKTLEGTALQNFQRQPTTGVSQAAGRIGNVNVAVATQLGRIDLVLSPAVAIADGVPSPADSKLNYWIGQGLALAKKLALDQPVFRPAVVLQASQEVDTALTAVNTVSTWAHNAPFPAGATDLMYQAVVRRQSKVDPTIIVHQLTRWNTGRQSVVRFEPATGAMQNVAGAIVASKYVDVFADDQTPVARDKFGPLMDEICDLARNILERGYDAL
jgi:hypothetical protein